MCEIELLKHLYAEHKHYCFKGTVQPQNEIYVIYVVSKPYLFIHEIHGLGKPI